ncbi:MAG: hypothetical protein IT381_33335 [Deltaproteobacteria bacterium]|nr:hypothetical protein [Deltaproteobacteria bacterium]
MKTQSGQKLSFEKLNNALKEVEEQMSDDVAVLAEGERRQLTGVRVGWENLARLVAEVAKEANVAIPHYDTASMKRDIADSEELALLKRKLSVIAARIDDAILVKRAAAYKTFLAHYRVLGGLATVNAEIAKSIESVEEFFAPQPKKKATANTDRESDEPQAKPTPAPEKDPVPAPVKVPA